MASLIPNDPRLRKTFEYLEDNWHDEMNRNLVETVDQANTLEADLGDAKVRLQQAESALLDHADRIEEAEEALGSVFTIEEAAAERVINAVATLSAAAGAGATSLAVTVTQHAIFSGDKLIAYDPVLKRRTDVVAAADRVAGSTALPVESLPQALSAGTALYLFTGRMRELLSQHAGQLASISTNVTTLGETVATHATLISQNADQIDLVSTRLETTQTNLDNTRASLEAQIQLNADNILLRASKAEHDALDSRVTTAEGQILLNANGIALAQSSINTTNTAVTNLTSRVTIAEGQISNLVSRIDTVEGDVSVLSTWRGQTDDMLADLALRLDDSEGAIVGMNTAIQQTADAITSTVSRAVFDKAILGPASAVLSLAVSGPNVGSLPVQALGTGVKFYQGDQLLVVDLTTGNRYLVVVASTTADGGTAIPITPAPVTAAAGSGIYLPDGFVRTQMKQTADKFQWGVFRQGAPGAPSGSDPLSAINEMLNGIELNANDFRSANFNGTVDANGIITSLGTQGWVLTKAGEFGAATIRLRGYIDKTIAGHLAVASYDGVGADTSRYGLQLYRHGTIDLSNEPLSNLESLIESHKNGQWWMLFHDTDGRLVFNQGGDNTYSIHKLGNDSSDPYLASNFPDGLGAVHMAYRHVWRTSSQARMILHNPSGNLELTDGNIVLAAGKTVDGVDVSALKTAFDQHVASGSHANMPTTSQMNTAIANATAGMATQSWVNANFYTQSWINTNIIARLNAAGIP